MTIYGIEVMACGEKCPACDEVTFSADQAKDLDAAIAQGVVRRGIREGVELKFVRKVAGLKARELATLLDVAPETVSRWEHGQPFSRLVALAVGELLERPQRTRRLLSA